MIKLVLSGLTLLLLSLGSTAKANLPKTISYQEQEFKLCAEEHITKGFFFEIVDVGIYYLDCSKNQGIFDDQTKLLRFAYLREVEGEQFTEGAIEYLEENLSTDQKSECMAEYKELNQSYKGVVDGDYYDLYLFNDKGIQLFLNQEHIVDMTNTACDSLYLNVWFGTESMDSQFENLHQKLKNSTNHLD